MNNNIIKELALDVYADGLKPAVVEGGKTFALVPKAINAALAPLRLWIAQKEYNVAETEKLLAKKLEKIDASKIVTPEAYVAVPALQAISYCINSEELREMYANLLSMSMLIDKKEMVHPSFVEIIKQLSPDEAHLIKKISEGGSIFPIIDLQIKLPDGGYNTIIHHFTTLGDDVCESPGKIYSYIDNLTRLSIIEVPSGVSIKDENAYKELENHNSILSLTDNPLSEGKKWNIKREMLRVTQYGRDFINTCVIGVTAE